MNRSLRDWAKSAQLLVFSLIVFLVPSNVFLKFFVDDAYISGILVDYLIIKLYGSDIFILVLFCLWIIEIGWRTVLRSLWKHKIVLGVVFASIVIHLIAHSSSTHLLSSVWYIVKLLECWLLVVWILEKKSPMLSNMVFTAVSCTIIFQSLLAGYQYLAQRPFFGYWFFGEPMFSFEPTVAKSAHPGALTILPYGTTTHPNVLAGVVVMFALYAMYLAGIEKKTGKLVIAGALVAVSAVVAWLSESGTAVGSLGIGVVGYWVARVLRQNLQSVALRLVSILALVILVGVPLWILFSNSADPSFQRRRELQQVALRVLEAYPTFGTGINQFTTVMQTFGSVSGTVRFIQPVHNLPLLWAAETGLAGVVFFALIIIIVHKKYSLNLSASCAVGLPLVLILSLDHYPMSVQSGMLLTTIILTEILEKRKTLH